MSICFARTNDHFACVTGNFGSIVRALRSLGGYTIRSAILRRLADLGDLVLVGPRTLEEAAIATDDLVRAISGEPFEGTVAEHDRVVGQRRVGQADRHARLRHRLLEQQPRGAIEGIGGIEFGAGRAKRLAQGVRRNFRHPVGLIRLLATCRLCASGYQHQNSGCREVPEMCGFRPQSEARSAPSSSPSALASKGLAAVFL